MVESQKKSTYPLTPMQKGMLFQYLSTEHADIDVEQVRMQFREPVHKDSLLRAWQQVMDKHPILRTRFRWEGMSEPLQIAEASIKLEIESVEGSEQKLDEFANRERARGFSLEKAPLMRLLLVSTSGAETLFWTFHHILLDGRSFPIVLEQVMLAYQAFRDGKNPSGQHALKDFETFVRWHHDQDWSDSRTFWQAHLSDVTGSTPLPWSPAGEGPGDDSTGVGYVESRLGKKQTLALDNLVAEHAFGWSALVEAAWALLLWRHSNESDVIYGITRAGRRDTVLGSENMVGLFINTVPIRIKIDPETSFMQLAERIRAEQQASRTHQHVGLADIQRLAAGAQGRLFDSLVLYDHQALDDAMASRAPSNRDWPATGFKYRGRTGYPLTLLAYGGNDLLLELEFDRSQYTQQTAEHLIDRLKVLLTAVAAHPDAPLHQLSWITPDDQEHVLSRWNDTARAWTQPARSVAEAVEASAQRRPDAPAVIGGSTTTSYRELNALADTIATALMDEGVRPGDRVAVATDRHAPMIAALLAVHRAGAAYVPCDPHYPAERIEIMLGDSCAKVIITDNTAIKQIPHTNIPTLNLDALPSGLAEQQGGFPDADPSRIAFVIFTSGSTGRPKGVMVSQNNVLNYLHSTAEILGAGAGGRMLAVTTLSFDIAVLELFMPLLTGGTVVMASADDAKDGNRIGGLIREHAVDRMQATPVTYQLLLAAGWQPPERFVAIIGGEALAPNLARDIRGLCDGLTLWNIYGPTETTVWSTCDRVEDGPITIGKPLHNTRCYVVDQWDQLLPPGVPGELLIGGDGVTAGYIGREDLTAERFIAFSYEQNGRVFRSGDRVYWRHDGRLAYLERMDSQVKLRGFRIELGEIETTLADHSDVSQAVCILSQGAAGARLIAYVTVKGSVKQSTLRAWLRERLPSHMVPAVVVTLEAFPLTPNGKVNRRALPAPDAQAEAPQDESAPARTETEQAVATIWSEVLEIPPPGRDALFFEIGGDSLRLVEVLGRLQAELGADLSVTDLFRFTTIAQISEYLDASNPKLASDASTQSTNDRAAKRRVVLSQRRRGALRKR